MTGGQWIAILFLIISITIIAWVSYRHIVMPIISFFKDAILGFKQGHAKIEGKTTYIESSNNDIPTRKTIRQGKSVVVDAVFDAWTSGNLNQMLKVVELDSNLIDRHHLLHSIVEACYKKRKQGKYNRLCAKYAELHIKELSGITKALIDDFGDLPNIYTFKYYAILLTENGNYEKAISICNQAIDYGLSDGTKSGFKGRILRIQKKLMPHSLTDELIRGH